mmetsp:Transcript_1519/g.6000  ORF Transcript_1519/g.6000 Transcript_1519/m.6000 type:complete len:293 (-) Transcript_1519:277-1155(-)
MKALQVLSFGTVAELVVRRRPGPVRQRRLQGWAGSSPVVTASTKSAFEGSWHPVTLLVRHAKQQHPLIPAPASSTKPGMLRVDAARVCLGGPCFSQGCCIGRSQRVPSRESPPQLLVSARTHLQRRQVSQDTPSTLRGRGIARPVPPGREEEAGPECGLTRAPPGGASSAAPCPKGKEQNQRVSFRSLLGGASPASRCFRLPAVPKPTVCNHPLGRGKDNRVRLQGFSGNGQRSRWQERRPTGGWHPERHQGKLQMGHAPQAALLLLQQLNLPPLPPGCRPCKSWAARRRHH